MYLILGNCHIIDPLPFQTSWTLALVIFVIYEIEELVYSIFALHIEKHVLLYITVSCGLKNYNFHKFSHILVQKPCSPLTVWDHAQ